MLRWAVGRNTSHVLGHCGLTRHVGILASESAWHTIFCEGNEVSLRSTCRAEYLVHRESPEYFDSVGWEQDVKKWKLVFNRCTESGALYS